MDHTNQPSPPEVWVEGHAFVPRKFKDKDCWRCALPEAHPCHSANPPSRGDGAQEPSEARKVTLNLHEHAEGVTCDCDRRIEQHTASLRRDLEMRGKAQEAVMERNFRLRKQLEKAESKLSALRNMASDSLRRVSELPLRFEMDDHDREITERWKREIYEALGAGEERETS